MAIFDPKEVEHPISSAWIPSNVSYFQLWDRLVGSRGMVPPWNWYMCGSVTTLFSMIVWNSGFVWKCIKNVLVVICMKMIKKHSELGFFIYFFFNLIKKNWHVSTLRSKLKAVFLVCAEHLSLTCSEKRAAQCVRRTISREPKTTGF